MIGNGGQKHKEEKLSQFIDELNQEKKPSMKGLDVEKDQELYQLLDTVRAVKRIRTEDIPEPSEIRSYRRRNNRKGILKYGAIAACLIIAVIAVGNKNLLKFGLSNNKGSSNVCEGAKEDSQDLTANDDGIIKEYTGLKSGSMENIASVYTSCNAAASLLEGLPEELQIHRVVKLENSPYTYRVSCIWDKESFMDIYILPGKKGYGMDYQNNCYSFMDGTIEENTDAGFSGYYEAAVSTLSWSGDGFTITIVSDRGHDEIRSLLEKITGYKSIPLSQQEKNKLKEEN